MLRLRSGSAELLGPIWDQYPTLPCCHAAYEKRAIALSRNLHPAGFDELVPKTLATATIDRLMHRATSAKPPANTHLQPTRPTIPPRLPSTNR
jgi:hypothetical protein